MAKDHFVPRHYLRRFAIERSEEVVVATVSPYRFIGRKGIGGQCQQADFYEGDKALDALLGICENDLAPVLVRIVQREAFTEPELVALKWLAVTLHVRTRKAAEAHKVLPKRIFHQAIQSAITNGTLPPPPEGKWTEDMVGCRGMSGVLIKKATLPCWLEMHTLACKLLKAQSGTCFITSDNPVVVLNQFCASVEPHCSFAGYSRSGFQLFLPISPDLCLLFYDAKVYKVGSARQRLTSISQDDVELVNALQVQSAESAIYFHKPALEADIKSLIGRYATLRVPVQDSLRTLPGTKRNETLLHLRESSVRIPKPWGFCRLRRHIKSRVGERRDPPWSALIGDLMTDWVRNPNAGDIQSRLEKIVAGPHSLKHIGVR